MFSDPSGGVFTVSNSYITWIAAQAAEIGTAALIGAVMYLVQVAITGNLSLGGFAKSIFMGALTGAVSGGLGQVFSASGFWASVGNGALAGGGSSGITSLINGTNFFEGLLKGAVIGGAVGAVSYAIKYYTTKTGSETSYVEDIPENRVDGNTPVGSRDYARDLYEKQFGVQDGLDKSSIYNRANPGGTMENGSIVYTDKSGTYTALSQDQAEKESSH